MEVIPVFCLSKVYMEVIPALCLSKVYMEVIPALSSTVFLGILSLKKMPKMRLPQAAHVEGDSRLKIQEWSLLSCIERRVHDSQT